MSVSKERVRQIQVTALEKLHRTLTAEPVLA
jgi:DNA-directed RNA polymerase sigma subunit (sigma70/sigma32)